MDACHETFVRTHGMCATSHPSSKLRTAGDNDVRAGSLGTGVPPGGDVGPGGGCACVGPGVRGYGKWMCLPLNLVVNLKPF